MKPPSPNPGLRWTHMASSLTALLLAGCQSLPLDALGPRSAGPAAAGSAAPSGPTGGPGQTAGNSAEAVKVSASKRIDLVTFEGDLDCTVLVAPFGASQNVGLLTELVVRTTVEEAQSWLENFVAGKTGSAPAAGGVPTMRIPATVRTTALRMNWLPMEMEQRYGQMLLDKMNLKLVDPNSRAGKRDLPQAEALFAEVLAGVKEPHDYKFQLRLVADDRENATALPGGIILLNAGLLKKPDMARFALAHEIAHVLQRHETRAVQARIIDTVALRGTAQDLVRSIESMKNTAEAQKLFALVLSGKLQFERHFADQELHSDGCAVRLLRQAVNNDARVAAAVEAFTKSLEHGLPSQPAAPAGPAAAAPGAPGQAGNLLVAANTLRSDAQTLYEVVSRPIDRHPAPQERIDNLQRVSSGLKKAKAKSKDGAAVIVLPAAPSDGKRRSR